MGNLLKSTVRPPLPEGEYPIRITNFEEFENEKGGYVQLTISMPDRIIKQNFFPSNIDYLGAALRDQLGIKEQKELSEVLEATSGQELFGIISYNEYGMNLGFRRPKAVVVSKEVEFK